ncbi:uncharacterized protein [Anabrus simplex]|uniref:uncharacterized protein n=1 Tax=Anabrus simplex TaxID=316456 RepID=UPI0035A372B2
MSRKRQYDESRSDNPLRRGVPLNSQACELVRRTREFYEREREFVRLHGRPSVPADQVVERTSQTLGLSKRTVVQKGVLLQELKEKWTGEPSSGGNKAESGDLFLSTPGKKRFKPSPVTGIDSFQADAIRRHVYDYYSRKEYPVVAKLLVSLKQKNLFSGGKTSLKSVLRALGFRYKKLNGRKLLLEKSHIVMARSIFLNKLVGKDLHEVIWLDETWVNAGECIDKSWTDDSPKSSGNQPTGKGARLIIAHAGSSSGFVEGGLLMFRSKKTGDYHEDMDHVRFLDWFKKLLQQLKGPSVIVMDNAPYHSVIMDKTPTSSARKELLVEWLQARNIPAHMGMTKLALYALVKQNKPVSPTYVVDEVAKEQGHEVVRLPPYHCHFNPIELVWSDVKRYVRTNNKSFTITEVERLFREGIALVDAASWRKKVGHVATLINSAMAIDGIISFQPVKLKFLDLLVTLTALEPADYEQRRKLGDETPRELLEPDKRLALDSVVTFHYEHVQEKLAQDIGKISSTRMHISDF